MRVVCLLVGLGMLAASSATGQVIVDLATIRPAFESFFESRRIQTGPYGQYRMQAGDTAASHYASLDVSLSRTIMGEDYNTSLTETQRGEWIGHIQSFALPDGTYSSTHGHNQLHANGMVIGALGPLGGKQLYPADRLYAPFDQPDEVATYLEQNINWTSQWAESHKFWGGLHLYSFSSQATDEWRDTVFDWLDANVDSSTGWFRVGQQPSSNVQGLGGGAHIWPIYEHWGREFPEPERVIDRVLSMQLASGRFGAGTSGYLDLDALYALKYMRTLAPEYRSAEIDATVEDFGVYLTNNIGTFLASGPSMHETLSKVGAFGLLNQLSPGQFPDSTGVAWTDIFTDPKLYLTSEVETLFEDLTPVGDDAPSVYSSVVVADAPIGYWRLGQTGGLVAPSATGDSSLKGLYVGVGNSEGPASIGQPGPRPADGFYGMGEDNRAPHFDGDTGYVTVADSPAVDLTAELTMEAWIKLDEFPEGNGGILSKYVGSGAQRGFNLYVDRQNGGIGALGMVISPDGLFAAADSIVDNVPLPIGKWMHVAGVFKPDDFMRLYINGELVEQRTEAAHDVPSQIYSNTAELWIGAQFSSSTDFRFPGTIDEVAIYDRALTSGEIRTHYQAATSLPGDFNGDGVVSLADYTVWRDAMGQQGQGLVADADFDGVVSEADYLVWKQHFGASRNANLAEVTAVPTPSSSVLLLATMLPLLSFRRNAF